VVRLVHVSTVEWPKRRRTMDENVKQALSLIDEASVERPDIVCFPENFPSSSMDTSAASTIPGPITDALGEKAKQHNMYVICPMIKLEGERLYNAAALLDRGGKVVGKYRKIHPTIDELKMGITPGTSEHVFTTDFGKIGIVICFDIQYPGVAENLARNGAEIIFFPAEFPAQTYLKGIAWQYAVNVVSSIREPEAQIVDLAGCVVARGGGRGEEVDQQSPRDISYSKCAPVVSAILNLDCKRFEIDSNLDKVPMIRKKYGNKIDIRVFKPDDELVIASHSCYFWPTKNLTNNPRTGHSNRAEGLVRYIVVCRL